MYMDGRYAPRTADINTRYSKTGSDFSTYAYSGKVMLVAVIALFLCCLLFAFFHFYSRWFLLRRSRSPHLPRHRLRRSSFSVDSPPSATSQGLDSAILKSLPTFIYSGAGEEGCTLECAVCLSEFEFNETGRVLPKCNHGFHSECIDTWFLSHSSCPLCRAPVQLSPTETIINMVGSDPISSGLRPSYSCNRMGYSLSSSSLPQLLNSIRVDVAPAAPRGGIGSDSVIGSKHISGPEKTLTRYLSI